MFLHYIKIILFVRNKTVDITKSFLFKYIFITKKDDHINNLPKSVVPHGQFSALLISQIPETPAQTLLG